MNVPEISSDLMLNRSLSTFLLPIIFGLSLGGLKAQDLTQTIRGEIVDQDTRMPLIGATVVVVNSDPILGASTDFDGRFEIQNVPLGRTDLVVKYLGYEPKSIPQIDVGSAKQVVLKIEMLESTTSLQEVVVQAKKDPSRPNNEMSLVSTRSFSLEQSERFAASMNDPGRMALSFAGVNLTDDVTNEISIRGNSPKGLLWRLEGVDIPNPNHFGSLGSTGGPVGIINNNTLDKSDFFTGAFPSMYGNATAGVFDLSLKSGNNKKTELTGQIGFNGFEGGIEGPFSKNSRASYLVYYRYSAVALIQEAGLSVGTGSAVPYYQDLTFKLNFPTKNGNWTAYGIGGKSNIIFEYDPNDTSNFFNDGSQRVNTESEMGIIGVNYLRRFSKNAYAKFNVAANTASLEINVDTADALGNDFKVYNDNSRISKIAAHSFYAKKFGAKNNIKIGNNTQQIHSKLSDSTFDTDISAYRILRNEDEKTYLIQNYVQWQHRVRNNFVINSGINHQYFALNNKHSIEPRFGMSYNYKWRHKFAAAVGLHHQIQPYQLYYVRTRQASGQQTQTNLDLDFTRSMHYVVSYEFLPVGQWHFKAEAYYQSLSNLPVENHSSSYSAINEGADFNSPSRDSLVNKGYGSNIGMEFTIERGKLWMLQTRSGKRTTKAALRIAVDMVEADMISKSEAVCMIDPTSLDQLLHPTIAEGSERKIIGMGLPASPGAGTGQIVFNPIEAGELKAAGKSVILVRVETSPEDIRGMHAAKGILTIRGGITSHAAVIARGLGLPCVVGAADLSLDKRNGKVQASDGRILREGDVITIDGSAGEALVGAVDMLPPELGESFQTLMTWADELRDIGVRANQ